MADWSREARRCVHCKVSFLALDLITSTIIEDEREIEREVVGAEDAYRQREEYVLVLNKEPY